MAKKDFFKYYKMTMSYSNGAIWYLLLVALCPSILIAFLFSPYGSVEFLCHYGEYYGESFSTMYYGVLGINTKLYGIGIIGIIAVPFFFSILFGAIERHMRVGEFSLGISRIGARLNFNFITALKFAFMLFATYEIFKFFQVVMFFLFSRALYFGWALALSIIWYLIIFFVEFFLLSAVILWVPTMLQTGLSSTKALGLSARQGVQYSLGTMIILLIPTLPMIILMIINSLLDLRLDIILDAILLTITSVYYVVLMYTMFFDINGIEREDLKKVNLWKKPKRRFRR